MRFLKYFFIFFASVFAIVFIIGMFIDPFHAVAIKAHFSEPQLEVWDAIANFEKAPEWNPNLTSSSKSLSPSGKEIWTEDYEGRVFILETVEHHPPSRIVRKILNDELPYQGVWIFETEPSSDGGTWLIISEEATIKSPFFRFVAKYVMGYAATIAGYMQAYGRKFNAKIQIEIVKNDQRP